MRLRTVKITDAEWAEFVRSQDEATFFHQPAWATIISDCYGLKSFALLVEDGGETVAGLPVVEVRRPGSGRRWVSLPFSDYCPLLVGDGIAPQEVVGFLRGEVFDAGVRELEIRGELPALDQVIVSDVGYQHRLELPHEMADLHPTKNITYNRNRARRGGVKIVRGTRADDVMAYYRLHTLTRRRLGVPVQPKRLFELIAERLVEPGLGFVATAMLDGQPLASGLYLEHNGTVLVKFHASDPSARDSGGMHLCDWEVMSAAVANGAGSIDFGRTDLDAEGLRSYKCGWRAEETVLRYSRITRDQNHVVAAVAGQGGLSRRIIQRSPVWVCRALGEVLYKWTA